LLGVNYEYGAAAASRCCRIVIGMPSSPANPDRYTARPLGEGVWFVWDTRRNEPVFGSDLLPEDEAREAARRLNQAYRRAMSPVDIPLLKRPHVPDLKLGQLH
jgi:hypothetical protein